SERGREFTRGVGAGNTKSLTLNLPIFSFDFHHHTGDVIVLWRRPHKTVDVRHDAAQQLFRSSYRTRFDNSKQALLLILLEAFVFCLYQTVSKDHQPIAWLQSDGARFISRVGLNSQRQASRRQTFYQPGGSSQNGSIVAGIDVKDGSADGVEFR